MVMERKILNYTNSSRKKIIFKCDTKVLYFLIILFPKFSLDVHEPQEEMKRNSYHNTNYSLEHSNRGDTQRQ